VSEPIHPKAPPLGRYGPDPADETVEVRLLRVPLRIYRAARQRHDDLLREFTLLSLQPRAELDQRDTPGRLLDLMTRLTSFSATRDRPDREIDEAAAAGARYVDLAYQVPVSAAAAARELARLMDEADEFCRQEQLLTLERTPVEREFAHWYCGEFERQVAGQPPQPWTGPADP
jgi:hypothetical protein